jgi:hypothetical protein
MSWSEESFNSTKSVTTLVKTSCASKGVMIQPPLNYHAVKRLILVNDDESIEWDEDGQDALGEELVEAATDRLSFEERDGSTMTSVDPAASLAALFDRDSTAARDLKPKLWIAWDVKEDPSIVGLLTACELTCDNTLGTGRFTQAFLDSHSIPRLHSGNCLFVDVVSSTGDPHGVGALLLLSAYLGVCRSRKYSYLATIAVSAPGLNLCERLGMHAYNYREGGAQRNFCWCTAGELTAADISRRLRVKPYISDLCWRDAYTSRSRDRKVSRC